MQKTIKQSVSIGDVQLIILNAGHLMLDLGEGLAVPYAEWRDSDRAVFEAPIQMPVQCVLIKTPSRNLLVDASVYEFPPDSEYVVPGYSPPSPVTGQMAAWGLRASDIDDIIVTHMHFDHFNGLTALGDDGDYQPVYPNAHVYMGAEDLKSDDMSRAFQDPASLESRTLGVIQNTGRLHSVRGPHQLTPEVELIPTPGETPGHIGVRIESLGEVCYCLGDLYHHPVEVERSEWAVTWADQAAIQQSRERIAQAALAENALLVATHIEGFGRLEIANDGVHWVHIDPAG